MGQFPPLGSAQIQGLNQAATNSYRQKIMPNLRREQSHFFYTHAFNFLFFIGLMD